MLTVTLFAYGLTNDREHNNSIHTLVHVLTRRQEERQGIVEEFRTIEGIMTTLRPFKMEDLFKFNNINLDVLTETYNMSFYMSYMSKWPEAFTGESSTLQKEQSSEQSRESRPSSCGVHDQ